MDRNNEVQHFNSSNANARYFYDADNNIVEFISRNNLQQSTKGEFSIDDNIDISDIGFPNADIEIVANFLIQKCQLSIYSNNFTRFCAIGDEYGLFICIGHTKDTWYPTNDFAHPSYFKIDFTEDDIRYCIQYQKGS